MKQQIREIAKLLAEDPPKEEKARIKAESLIRDDNTVEAYEILQLNCELLSERINLITHSKECPADMISTVATIIWASAIVDIPELLEVRKQLIYKFGSDFDDAAMQNVGGVLNERVTSKLSIQPPSAYLVQTYLEKISDEHEVGWKPIVPLRAEDIAQPMVAPSGYSVQVGAASGLNKQNYDVGGSGSGGAAAAAAAAVVNIDGELSVPPTPTALPIPPKGTREGAYVPVLPTPAAVSVPAVANTSKIEEEDDDDDIEEVDIYVPAAPKSQPHSNNNNEMNSNRGRTQSAGENSKDKDDDDEDKTGGDDSYDDLAKRFAMLSK